MHESGLSIVSDVYTDDEMAVLIEIMRVGGFGTPASAIRCAVWKLAQHFEIDCPPHLFHLTSARRKSLQRRSRHAK